MHINPASVQFGALKSISEINQGEALICDGPYNDPLDGDRQGQYFIPTQPWNVHRTSLSDGSAHYYRTGDWYDPQGNMVKSSGFAYLKVEPDGSCQSFSKADPAWQPKGGVMGFLQKLRHSG